MSQKNNKLSLRLLILQLSESLIAGTISMCGLVMLLLKNASAITNCRLLTGGISVLVKLLIASTAATIAPATPPPTTPESSRTPSYYSSYSYYDLLLPLPLLLRLLLLNEDEDDYSCCNTVASDCDFQS